MSVFSALAQSRAPAFGLAAVGVLWGGMAGLMPDLKAQVGASDALMGLAWIFAAVGGLVTMWAAPWIRRRLGRFALPIVGGLVAVSLVYPLAAQNVGQFAAIMFCLGLSVAALDILANVEISARETRLNQHLMNVNHAVFSFAFAATAFGISFARQAGLGPAEILPVLAVITLGMAPFMYVAEAPPPEPQDAQTHSTNWAAIGLAGVILFGSFIGENGTEGWSALHIERTLGAAQGHGSLGPAMLGFVMGFGRLFGQVIAERLGHGRLIFWSAVLGVIGAVTVATAPTVPIVLLGVAVTAMGLAAVVPSANSMLGARVSDAGRAHALSRAWMLGILGFFVGPAMIGGVSELVGLRWAFVCVAGIIALILPAVWRLDRLPRRTAPKTPH